MEPNNKIAGGMKEKKTRRRLRLSCVECTKRRQKCDRKYPCSLCVSRGVSHLCRWETVPLARPAPARPPNLPSQEQAQTIQELLSHISHLEKTIEAQKKLQAIVETKIEPTSDSFLTSSPSSSSTLASNDAVSPYTSPGPDILPPTPSSDFRTEDEREPPYSPLCHIGPAVYATTSTLARLSVGHHGEYIGRGSLICALHSISTGNTSRFLYAKSTDSTSAYREHGYGFMSNPLIGRVEELIRNIPSRPVTEMLLQNFFAENNWRFGIPEEWFQTACSQMWNILEYPGHHGVQINANWLCLLFAVLADAPKKAPEGCNSDIDAECSDHYFTCAMEARRISEDNYLNKPNLSLMVSAADGTVLGCLAVPILSCYLCQTGRVSEAWKLVGNGIRNAEAVGVHRDPEWKQWQVMSKDEALLRRRTWWGLFIWDKIYSYLLGRPQMIRQEIFDVALPSSVKPDGTPNVCNFGQILFIQLAGLVGEVAEKCFAVEYPDCPTFFELDGRLERWEERLPPEYQQYRDDNTTSGIDPADLIVINHQRYNLLTWYLIVRTKLHIASLTGTNRPRQLRTDLAQSKRLCVFLSIRQIKLQCDTYDSITQYKAEHAGRAPLFPGCYWYFEGCLSLFEATVALLTTLIRHPWKERIAEADELAGRAIDVLTRVAREETGRRGGLARMGAEVLGALHSEDWWRAQVLGSTAPAVHNSPTTFQSPTLQGAVGPTGPLNMGYDWFASTTYSNIFGPPQQDRSTMPNDDRVRGSSFLA